MASDRHNSDIPIFSSEGNTTDRLYRLVVTADSPQNTDSLYLFAGPLACIGEVYRNRGQVCMYW